MFWADDVLLVVIMIILYSNEISDSVWFGLLKTSVDIKYMKVSKITNDFGIIFVYRDYDFLFWWAFGDHVDFGFGLTHLVVNNVVDFLSR